MIGVPEPILFPARREAQTVYSVSPIEYATTTPPTANRRPSSPQSVRPRPASPAGAPVMAPPAEVVVDGVAVVLDRRRRLAANDLAVIPGEPEVVVAGLDVAAVVGVNPE